MCISLFSFPRLFPFYVQYLFDAVRNQNFKQKIFTIINQKKIKSSTNVSCEHSVNFDQWEISSKNYKPIRASLSLVNKFTKNNCR